MFVVLEGADGVGKTTQIELLEQHFVETSGSVVHRLREPGGTNLGQEIRRLLLDPDGEELSATTEVFLFMAARSHLVEKVIRPALEAGEVVICDRFLWSSVVYQGVVGGLGVERILEQGRLATGGLTPDRTIILDLPVDEAVGRREERGEDDRFEQRGAGYQVRIREAFLDLARRFPEELTTVSASGPPEEVHARILSTLESSR